MVLPSAERDGAMAQPFEPLSEGGSLSASRGNAWAAAPSSLPLAVRIESAGR